MQAQTQTVSPITFKAYAEKSKAKRALGKSFNITAVDNFLREQDGKWGFLLKDGEPYAETIMQAFERGMAEEQAAAEARLNAPAMTTADAPKCDDESVNPAFAAADEAHDDTPTTSSAFAMMVNPPVAPTGEANTIVRDGKIIDPSAPVADDKGDHSVEAGVDPCPLCGGHHSAQTWANEGVSAFCHSCGKTYSVSTGREVRTGFKRDDVNKGYKIEKNRAEQNGVKRPSAGTLCGMVWAALDAVHAARMPVASDLDDIANANGWNRNNVSCEFYQWRKFNGIKGRQVKAK